LGTNNLTPDFAKVLIRSNDSPNLNYIFEGSGSQQVISFTSFIPSLSFFFSSFFFFFFFLLPLSCCYLQQQQQNN